MTEVLLYHHIQGLTEGVESFADQLRQAGHTVHTPDLFDGRRFDTVEEGMAFAREAGVGALAERGVAAAEGMSPDAVYAGFSSASWQPSSSRRPGPALVGRCSCPGASRSRSSGTLGPKAFRCRCTAKTATGSSPRTSRPRRRSSSPPTTLSCSSTGGGAPLLRLFASCVRPGGCGTAHGARAGVPRHGSGRREELGHP